MRAPASSHRFMLTSPLFDAGAQHGAACVQRPAVGLLARGERVPEQQGVPLLTRAQRATTGVSNTSSPAPPRASAQSHLLTLRGLMAMPILEAHGLICDVSCASGTATTRATASPLTSRRRRRCHVTFPRLTAPHSTCSSGSRGSARGSAVSPPAFAGTSDRYMSTVATRSPAPSFVLVSPNQSLRGHMACTTCRLRPVRRGGSRDAVQALPGELL